jgi:PhnB protein
MVKAHLRKSKHWRAFISYHSALTERLTVVPLAIIKNLEQIIVYNEEELCNVNTKRGGTMSTRLNPYLSFKDNAREAMEFYKTVFGGKLTMSTFKEFHASQDPSEDNKIMHSMLEADNGIVFMASDTSNNMEYRTGMNMSMSLSGDNETELRGYYEKLLAGGTIGMPLEKAPWGDTFGMCTDKFGVSWLVNITGQKA